jgi:pyruvate,water dikinase
MRNNNQQVPTITEWMKKIGLPNIESFRREDSTKRNRLNILNKIIKLPYLKARTVSAKSLADDKNTQQMLIKKLKQSTCLLKLLSKDGKLPKMRLRGKQIIGCIDWLKKQNINYEKYIAEIIPFNDSKIQYSTAFCVGHKYVWGEIIEGPIWLFSKGNYSLIPIIFFYDYKKWKFSHTDKRTQDFIKKVIKKIKIKSNKIKKIKKEINIKTNKHNFLIGYFEAVNEAGRGNYFVDYNRKLFEIVKKTTISISQGANVLYGICIGPGEVTGKIKIINNKHSNQKISKKEIMVCKSASFDMLPFIKNASGIITEQGAVLSHSAIVCRELKKPYVAHVPQATQRLKNGMIVSINATKGVVKIIK